MVHDHETRGDGWHLELQVARDGRSVRQLVMHSERCRATILTRGLSMGAGGTLAATKPFTTRSGAAGSWRLEARFPNRLHMEGSFHITTPSCDGGLRRFSAHSDRHRHGHRHGHVEGTPPMSYPRLGRATGEQRAQARGLWRRTLRAARMRFPSYAAARALGYAPFDMYMDRTPRR